MDQRLIQDDTDSYGSTDSMEEPHLLNVDPFTRQFETNVKNIEEINSNCRFLDTASKTIGTVKDNEQLRNTIQTTLFTSKKTIDLTNKEMQLLVIASRKRDIECKLRAEKLKTAFQESVETFSKLQRKLLIKLKRNLPTEPCPISHSEHKKNEDLAFDDVEQMMATPFEETLGDQQIIIEREDAVLKIENDITDINEIMRELNTLTVAHGFAIDSIESAVENAYSDVERAHQELEKTARHMNTRLKNILCLLTMVIIIVGVMSIMLYFTLEHN